MSIDTAVPTTFPSTTEIDESDVDALPPFGNPRKKCPLQVRYWEFRLQNEGVVGLTFETFLELRTLYLELREVDGPVYDMKFEKFVLARYIPYTTEKCYTTSDVAADMEQAWADYDEAREYEFGIMPIDIATADSRREVEESIETHKVDVSATPAPPALVEPLVKPLPKRRITARLRRRQVKLAIVAANTTDVEVIRQIEREPRRYLTLEESKLLKARVLSPSVTNWSQIKLSRRQQHWLHQAKAVAQNKRKLLAKTPRIALTVPAEHTKRRKLRLMVA